MGDSGEALSFKILIYLLIVRLVLFWHHSLGGVKECPGHQSILFAGLKILRSYCNYLGGYKG